MASGIEEILTTLYEMVQDAWSLPLGADKCVLERDKVLDLLDEISNQLPGELKQAKTIVESRNEVITNAKRAGQDQGAASGHQRLCRRLHEAHGRRHRSGTQRGPRVAQQVPRAGQPAAGKALAHHRGRVSVRSPYRHKLRRGVRPEDAAPERRRPVQAFARADLCRLRAVGLNAVSPAGSSRYRGLSARPSGNAGGTTVYDRPEQQLRAFFVSKGAI